jgi:hypothetical protein
VAGYPVTTTDRLVQPAVAIDQRHSHTVDLGLNPDLIPIFQPGFDGAPIAQFFQAGVGDGMSNRATGSAQRFG